MNAIARLDSVEEEVREQLEEAERRRFEQEMLGRYLLDIEGTRRFLLGDDGGRSVADLLREVLARGFSLRQCVGAALLRRGTRPVLAHPERSSYLEGEPGRVEGWLDAGWRLQLNLLSLV